MQYCEVPASSLRAAKTNTDKENCQSQHEKMPKDSIRNFDEVLEKMKDFPCIHRQLLHPSKTDVFNLPMEKSRRTALWATTTFSSGPSMNISLRDEEEVLVTTCRSCDQLRCVENVNVACAACNAPPIGCGCRHVLSRSC